MYHKCDAVSHICCGHVFQPILYCLQIVILSELNHDICQGETISSSNKFTVMLFRRFPQLHSNTIPSIPPDFEARKRLN